jgi:uncharacterized BrkB/YihY/UPF0761 family membrane protein
MEPSDMALSHPNGQSPRRAVGNVSPGPPRQGRAGEDSARRIEATGGVSTTGWREIAWRSYENAQGDRVLLVAAGVTFYGLLALFPATAAIVSLYGLFADPLSFNAHLHLLSGFLPQGALEVVGDQVKRITAHGPATLSFAFLGTLALSLWGANAGTKSIFDALNIIYKEREKRGFIKLTLWSLAFTIGAIGLAVLSLVGIIAVPLVLNSLCLSQQFGAKLLAFLRWPLLYLVVLFGLACLYRYGPSRTQPQWRWVTWGSAIAGGIWIAAVVVCRELRDLQRHLRLARGRDRLHDLDVALNHRRPTWRRDQCRDRAAGRPRGKRGLGPLRIPGPGVQRSRVQRSRVQRHHPCTNPSAKSPAARANITAAW